MKEVLQKFIASAGICSRRKATTLIKNGQVFVNKEVAELGMRVDKLDEVLISGKKIETEKKIHIKINKPAGYTCTNRIFKNEKNIFELLKDVKIRLFVVGRLDKNSCGLVILTNDGEITKTITHPRYGHEKEYVVNVTGLYEGFDIKSFINNCLSGFRLPTLGKVRMKRIEYLGEHKFGVVLSEGKKRQIRRMFEKFGLGVVDLKRIRINKLELGDLQEGEWTYLSKKEIKDLI